MHRPHAARVGVAADAHAVRLPSPATRTAYPRADRRFASASASARVSNAATCTLNSRVPAVGATLGARARALPRGRWSVSGTAAGGAVGRRRVSRAADSRREVRAAWPVVVELIAKLDVRGGSTRSVAAATAAHPATSSPSPNASCASMMLPRVLAALPGCSRCRRSRCACAPSAIAARHLELGEPKQ